MMVVIGKGFAWFVEAFPSIEVAVDRNLVDGWMDVI
jgi:hypothetical protein